MKRFGIYHTIDRGTTVFEKHIHEHYEIYLVMSNHVQIMIENGTFEANRGDLFIFAPFRFHKIVAENMDFERYVLNFSEQESVECAPCMAPAFHYVKKAEHHHFRLSAEELTTLCDIFETGIALRDKPGPMENYTQVKCVGNVLEFIMQLQPCGEAGVLSHPDQFARILKFVYENAEQGIDIHRISEEFGIGRTTLYKMFKENFNISPGEYILRAKLSIAVRLLSGGASVTEAANRSGFNSYAHFIRVFKQRMGKPPLAYTRQGWAKVGAGN